MVQSKGQDGKRALRHNPLIHWCLVFAETNTNCTIHLMCDFVRMNGVMQFPVADAEALYVYHSPK